MFESNVQISEAGQAGATGELRPIAWPELVARLAANRDLRSVLLARDDSGSASFNPCAAALLVRGEESKRDVNRDALVDGKYRTAEENGAAFGATCTKPNQATERSK